MKIYRTRVGQSLISTVDLLGINHGTEEHPLLYETMIFGGLNDGYQTRCGTLEETRSMHDKAVTLCKGEKE